MVMTFVMNNKSTIWMSSLMHKKPIQISISRYINAIISKIITVQLKIISGS